MVYLFGASIGLGLVFRPPYWNFSIGPDQLAFDIQARFRLFFQLHADGLQFHFDLSKQGNSNNFLTALLDE